MSKLVAFRAGGCFEARLRVASVAGAAMVSVFVWFGWVLVVAGCVVDVADVGRRRSLLLFVFKIDQLGVEFIW